MELTPKLRLGGGGDTITKSNIKGSILSIMMNNYYNLYTHKGCSVFIGATFGLAQIKEHLNYNILVENYLTNSLDKMGERSYKAKNINFAYGLILGGSYKVTDSAYIDVSYNWKNFGKTKFKTDKDRPTPTKNRHKGHIVGIGLRFDI